MAAACSQSVRQRGLRPPAGVVLLVGLGIIANALAADELASPATVLLTGWLALAASLIWRSARQPGAAELRTTHAELRRRCRRLAPAESAYLARDLGHGVIRHAQGCLHGEPRRYLWHDAGALPTGKSRRSAPSRYGHGESPVRIRHTDGSVRP
jgi:hypothetical protein